MENTLHANGSVQATERRKKNEYIEFQDRRTEEWRHAADRATNRGEKTTSLFFRNAAYLIEQESAQ